MPDECNDECCEECGREASRVRMFTRRALLGLAASAVGGLAVGLWSCREEEPRKTAAPATGISATTSAPATGSAPATTTSRLAATTTAEGPTPDLGSTLFPGQDGKPIATAADAPVIVIPRSDWTRSGPNLAEIRPMNGISRITVHHTAFAMTTDAWRPTAGDLENIREFHSGHKATDRHWADIAYHFVVDRAGRVWQARPLMYQGAHVRGHNEHNLGIVLLGNFEVQTPSAAQLFSLRSFIQFARGLYHVPLGEVFTHGELGQTSCPGRTLQAYMNRARKEWALAEAAG